MTAPCALVIRRLVVLVFLISIASADAQDTRPTSEKSSPSMEIGAAISSGYPSVVGLGLRVTGGNGGRFSVEGGLDWTDALNKQHYADQLVWFFFWQMKQTLWSDAASSRLFATYGTAGWIERQSVPPGRLRLLAIPPILPIVGIGWQQVVGKYVAVRIDGQLLLWPFEGGIALPRVSAGVSVPIRGYPR
jgi:hypothetical protein